MTTDHHLITGNGVRVVCFCSTGRDHGQDEFDQPRPQHNSDCPDECPHPIHGEHPESYL